MNDLLADRAAVGQQDEGPAVKTAVLLELLLQTFNTEQYSNFTFIS
jgi:hypothetical protein